MQSLPCALREVIQSTHNFTAMTICTRMNKLQGHDEGDMSVRWVSWMPRLALEKVGGLGTGNPHSREVEVCLACTR